MGAKRIAEQTAFNRELNEEEKQNLAAIGFNLEEERTNHTLDDIEFYKISVQKEIEVKVK